MLETQRKIRKQKPKLTTEELKSKHSRINNSLSLRTLLEHDRSAYKLILPVNVWSVNVSHPTVIIMSSLSWPCFYSRERLNEKDHVSSM